MKLIFCSFLSIFCLSMMSQKLIITEVMYNPKDDFPEYVEVFNNSSDLMLAGDFYFAVFNETTGKYRLYRISTNNNDFFFPYHYAVISKNAEKLREDYEVCNDAQVINMSNMPTLKNGEGEVIICKSDTIVVDEMFYSDKMHYSLLSETKGVSLERMSFDKSSMDFDNWHSAAETAGFATPGCENSHKTSDFDTDNLIEISPKSISPNNDGIDDFLNVSIKLTGENSWICSIRIFDEKGRMIKFLLNNSYVSVSDIFIWDGFMDNGIRSPGGIYILVADLFNESGNKLRKKYAFSVF